MNSKHTPAGSHDKYLSQSTVTKKDIENAERMVLQAVKMVDAAFHNHSMKKQHKQRVILRAIQDSREFKDRVEVYSEGLVGVTAKIKSVVC